MTTSAPTRHVPVYRNVLSALAQQTGDLTTDDATFVSLALITAVPDWTPAMQAHAYDLAVHGYRRQLEDLGWDVDLLPPPPAEPAAPAPTTVAEATSTRPDAAPTDATPRPVDGTLTLDIEGRAVLKLRSGHPARDAIRDLPGAGWDGEHGLWRFPVTRRTALALRAGLTGIRVSVTPDAAATLRAAAEQPATPDITLAADPKHPDKQRIEIRFEHTKALQDAVQRGAAARWDGPAKCWVTAPERAADLIRIATTHQLLVADDVTALAARHTAPFDYDGTIDGLRGVPVTELRSVTAVPARGKTPSLADRFASIGIESVYDLLHVVPRRYLDRSSVTPIRDLPRHVGEEFGLLATVKKVGQWDRVKRYLRITVTDGSGDLDITFFNAPWMASKFRAGDAVSLYGRADTYTAKSGRSYPQLSNPVMDRLGDDTALIVPVYPQSEKNAVTTWDLHTAAAEAVTRLGELADPLPDDVRDAQQLPTRADALRNVHHPATVTDAEVARRRLAFDELLRMQLALGMRRHASATETGVVHTPTGTLTGALLASLPFPLTGAQQRVTAEIVRDLTRPHPMHRLLQGDVGAGKSICAFFTLLAGIEGGYQGALMAPTEILASQLHAEAADRLAGFTHPDGRELTVRFLANKTRAKEKREILAGLADGSIDLVVGTHALLSDDVTFANLGIVVIDEQHRFGVEQRAALRGKGVNGTPDLLVMTATPIPRTSAMTVYGDLDQSILDELPPGRTPIQTSWLNEDPVLDGLTGPPWDLVREHVAQGRQAYIVASLVEDNEKIAAESAEAAYELLQHGALHGLRLGMVHGKQDRTVRDETMLAFKNGELDVLVATTVIEVGVNVPNATVMVVLNATRFGIAQLHQIRGRVGRGQHASFCVLTGKAGSADAVRRMQALCESTDGFYLSEVDLDLRGEGSVFGARQSGQTDLRVANLKDDRELVALCRNQANDLLDGDPTLARRPGLRTEVRSALGDDAEEWLAKS